MIKHAIIVGGGIGGLSLAIGLRRLGIDFTLYEQTPAFGVVGAGLAIWPNAIRALRELGLADAVIAAGSPIQEGALLTWQGAPLSRTRTGDSQALFGEPTIAIHRARLHEILLAALPADCVRSNETCSGFAQDETGVTVRLTSKGTARAELLIGADGIHSVIRQQMFPEARLLYSGYTAWRGVVTTDDEVALGRTSESWGCGSRFGIVPISRHEIYWFATGNTPEGMKLREIETRASLLERFRDWHAPIESLIGATPADAILHNDIYDIEPLAHWSQGRVTLLGDAAHPTTPNLGQGACQAIESAATLTRCLAQESDLSAALHRYETERRQRTAWITLASRQVGRIGQMENKLACSLRNLMLRLTPDFVMKKRLVKVVGRP